MADEQPQSPEQQPAEAPQAEAAPIAEAGAEQQPAEEPVVAATDAAEPDGDGQPEAGDGAAEGESPPDAADSPPEEELSDEVRRILHLSVPVIVKLADKQLSLGDIIDLSPGSIVEFARSADTPLELQVNNKVIGRGTAVKVGEKFGLRIDEIRPVEDTIRSLGV